MESEMTMMRDELARILGMSPRTVKSYEHRKPEELPPAVKVGRRRVYLRETVHAFLLERQGVGGKPVPSQPPQANTAAAPRARGRPRKTEVIAGGKS